MVDGISSNVLLPTCKNMISSFTSNYNKQCVINRPDITSKINGGTISKINGGTISNSTIITPPKVIKSNLIIQNIFDNDTSIYLIDAP